MKNKLPALIISITGSLAISGFVTLVVLVLFPRWNPGLIRALSRSTADYTRLSQWIWTLSGFVLTFALSALLSVIVTALFQREQAEKRGDPMKKTFWLSSLLFFLSFLLILADPASAVQAQE